MKEVIGKYNTAKIFTDVVDEKSIEQVKLLCDQPFVEGSKIRMMPDIHAGAGCTIGTTMTITDKVVPNLVGVDIGCGMLCVELGKVDLDLEKLDKVIREHIPSGFEVRKEPHWMALRLDKLHCRDSCDIDRAFLSVGTLGGGNHFIEVDKDDEGNLYLVIHTGSRHLGVEVCNYYQENATALMEAIKKKRRLETIDKLKSSNRTSEISSQLATLNDLPLFNIPKELSYAYGKLFDRYIHDMEMVQKFAHWNRIAIAETIRLEMELEVEDAWETTHNYIDTENMILRKGAVSARKGEKLLIPINMRDGSLICVGKGNPDWNYSAPHGAGRLFGRMAAKKNFSVEEFKESMEGIYTTSVGEDTLDECPMAYKSMDDIVNNITDTVDILKVIKPIYNFKASE